MKRLRLELPPAGLAFVLAALALPACVGREEPSDAGPDDAGPADAGGDPTQGPLVLHFQHRVEGAALTLSSDGTPYTSAAGNSYGLTRLSYFVTDVVVTMSDDSTVSAAGPHYLDADDDTLDSVEVASQVAPGELKSIAFTMGIPAAQNTSGSMPNPPESLMSWPDSMGGGYHYMKLEGRYLNSEGSLANLRAHSGPTDGADNSFPVTLDATGRSVPAGGATLEVVMNIEQWFKDPHLLDFNEFFQIDGIMADPVKQAQLKDNGADVFALEE